MNLIGQSTAVGSGVTLQQIGAAQLVTQQPGSVPLLNTQHITGYISTDKLNALSRSTAVSSQPVIVTSAFGGQQVNSGILSNKILILFKFKTLSINK